MKYDISRIAGSRVSHIRIPGELASLCGAQPLPIRQDIKPTSLWLRMRETEVPLDHAGCERCRNKFREGASDEQG